MAMVKKKKDSQKHKVTQWPNAFLKRKCSPNHCPQRIAWLVLLWSGYRTQALSGILEEQRYSNKSNEKNKIFLSLLSFHAFFSRYLY